MSLATFIKHNWLTIFCTIVALMLSLYLFKLSGAPPEPILLLDPVRTTIIDSTRVTGAPLRVVQANGEEIIGDVTSIRFYFWNAGRKAIKPSNVLESLIITLDSPESQMLDYRILRSSRQVVKSVLKPNAADPNRSLVVSFKILEQGDGFAGQIIFRGERAAKLVMSGTLEGVREIITHNVDIKNDVRKIKLHYILLPTSCFLFFMLIGALYYSRLRKENPNLTTKEKIVESYKASTIWLWTALLFGILAPSRIQNAYQEAYFKLMKQIPKDLYIQTDGQEMSFYENGKDKS